MKKYPLLNKTQRHEDVRESGSIAPRILNLGTTWRSVVSFTLPPLYPRGSCPRYTFDMRLGGPGVILDVVAKRKNPIIATPAPHPPEFNPDRPTGSPVSILTERSSSILCQSLCTQPLEQEESNYFKIKKV